MRNVEPRGVLLCTLLAGSILAVLLGCDPVLSIDGTVHEPNGRPVESASVALSVPGRVPDRATTAKDGTFSVGIVGAKPSQARLSIQKSGYVAVEQAIKRSEEVVDIVLVPVPERR